MAQGIGEKAKLTFQAIAHRITGFSIPIFGVQWNPPKPERDTVQRLMHFLEDRRVLYVPYYLEVPGQVEHSLIQVREELTKALQDLGEKLQGRRVDSGHARRCPKIPLRSAP